MTPGHPLQQSALQQSALQFADRTQYGEREYGEREYDAQEYDAHEYDAPMTQPPPPPPPPSALQPHAAPSHSHGAPSRSPADARAATGAQRLRGGEGGGTISQRLAAIDSLKAEGAQASARMQTALLEALEASRQEVAQLEERLGERDERVAVLQTDRDLLEVRDTRTTLQH